MKDIILKTGGAEIFVEGVNVYESGQWKIVQEENYIPDREEYVVKNFNLKFPQFESSNFDYDKICELSSRSTLVGEWLASTNASYAIDEQPPQYLREVMTPDKFIETVKKLKIIKGHLLAKTLADKTAADIYSTSLKLNTKTYKDAIKTVTITNEIKVLNLRTNDLPISLQMAIMAYTPASASESPNSKVYAREIFVQYKLALLRYCKNYPSTNLDELIENLKKE